MRALEFDTDSGSTLCISGFGPAAMAGEVPRVLGVVLAALGGGAAGDLSHGPQGH
jgi:hypothetical protein